MNNAINVITLIIAAATLAATVFGIWFSRCEKQPFKLSKGSDGIVILTRTRSPKVQVVGVWVLGQGIATLGNSNRAAQFFNLDPDGWQPINIGDAPAGSVLEVDYNRLWPWWSPGPQRHHSEEKKDARIKKIDQNHKSWKKWGGPLP